MRRPPSWLRWALKLTGAPTQWGFAIGLVLGAWLLGGPLAAAAGWYLLALLATGAQYAYRDAEGEDVRPSPWLPAGGCAVAVVVLQASGHAPLLFQGSAGIGALLILGRELVSRRYQEATP